jgi:transcriptional regulator with XRE-family HTH domain
MTFGEKLRAKRKESGYTQEELAKLTNLSQGVITAYERGVKTPHINNLNVLARALRCKPEELKDD